MKKKTIKYEYKMPKPIHWRGAEIGKESTQAELAKFVSECKLWKLFVREKGAEK